MNNFKKMLLISILVALASQVDLKLLESEFTVSAGAIFFVIYLYYYGDNIKPVPFGLLTGGMVFILRLIVHQIIYSNAYEIATSYIPEIVSYVAYAVFLLLYY